MASALGISQGLEAEGIWEFVLGFGESVGFWRLELEFGAGGIHRIYLRVSGLGEELGKDG